MLISEAQKAFLAYLEFRRGSTATTLVTYQSILGQFVELVGNKEVGELTLADVDRFAEVYSLRGFAPKTYRNKLCVIKSFIKYLYAKELTNIRPESVEIPRDRQVVTTYLTEDEEERFLAAAKCNPRDYAIFQVLFTSGLRVSELCNLKVLDIFRRSVSVKNGKGRKHRVTFISPVAEAAINAYLLEYPHDGVLFPNPNGAPLSRVVIARKTKYYAQKACISKDVTPHTIRHTFATRYLDKRGRIEDLQQMLGHADLKTTMLYLHFTNERLHSSYDTIMV